MFGLFCISFLQFNQNKLYFPLQEDAAVVWAKIEQVADRVPSRRSGHTLTALGTSAYLFGGKRRYLTLHMKAFVNQALMQVLTSRALRGPITTCTASTSSHAVSCMLERSAVSFTAHLPVRKYCRSCLDQSRSQSIFTVATPAMASHRYSYLQNSIAGVWRVPQWYHSVE
jgi:hypothetical protein